MNTNDTRKLDSRTGSATRRDEDGSRRFRRTSRTNPPRQTNNPQAIKESWRERKLERRLDRETRPHVLGRPMNPNKLDVTKLDQQAAELGFSYRQGSKGGAGYNVIDDISGDTVLGDDDFTAPLKAVKEYFDTIAKQLKAKAKQLGFSYVQEFRGPRRIRSD